MEENQIGQRGFVANIQPFSLDDGPGIRTTVFFRGCNLRCAWCHNPECIPFKAVLRYGAELCIGCGACANACKNGCHRFEDGIHIIDRMSCTGCGACTKACPSGALELNGRAYSADELTERVLRDRTYYEKSGGGVTFSGGEPVIQNVFLKEMLTRLKAQGVHTAVDTAGNLQWEMLEYILPETDLFLYDVKMLSAEKHRQATGVDNQTILRNLDLLILRGARIWVRVPVIPAYHDEAELAKIAEHLKPLPVERIELIPYHRYGTGKYKALGIPYTLNDCKEPDKEFMQKAGALFTGAEAEIFVRT